MIPLLSFILIGCIVMFALSITITRKDKRDDTKQNQADYFKGQAK